MSIISELPPAVECELRSHLRSRHFGPDAINDVCEWYRHLGDVLSCPTLAPGARETVQQLIDRAELEARPGADVEADPADWPEWTDADVYEPTEADAAWWAAESNAAPAPAPSPRLTDPRALDAVRRSMIGATSAAAIVALSNLGHQP